MLPAPMNSLASLLLLQTPVVTRASSNDISSSILYCVTPLKASSTSFLVKFSISLLGKPLVHVEK